MAGLQAHACATRVVLRDLPRDRTALQGMRGDRSPRTEQIRGLRRRDREFAAAYDDANAEILELLEDRAVEGALNGFKGKPILNRAGEVVGHERVYENCFLARPSETGP